MKSLITSILFIFSLSVIAQGQYSSFKVLEKSTIKIDGTSNIHDWTCDVEQINSDIRFNPEALVKDDITSPVESLSLTIPVKKIESGKGGMNNKMYDALKEEKHPNINFRMTSSSINSVSNGSFTLKVDGKLTIAGMTKTVSIPVSATKVNSSTYQFSGEYEIDMTEFDMEPPSALFGTVSSGKMVTVRFDVFVGSL